MLKGLAKARSLLPAQVAFGLLLSLLILGSFLGDLDRRYNAAIEDGKTKALSFAKIIAEHTALTFDVVEHTLREAVKIREQSSLSAGVNANESLRLLRKSSPLVVAIGWTDADGNVVAHSYEGAAPRPNISTMAHFVMQRDSPPGGLFVAPPYRSVVVNKWYTAASLRLDNPDGSFAGVVTAPVDQTYFSRLYRSIDLGAQGSISLYHRDGGLLVREPEAPEAIGKSFRSGPLMTQHLPRATEGAYEAVSPIDGTTRILAYKAVSMLPLVVVVTTLRQTF